jgi:oligoendopeptidase F
MTLSPKRAEVPVEQTWRLEDIFATPEAWEDALTGAAAEYDAMARYKGTMAGGAAALLAYLRAAEVLLVKTNNIVWYADCTLYVDGTNAVSQSMAARVRPLVARATGLEADLGTELVRLPEGTLERYLAEEPGLASYRTYLEDLVADRPFMLAPEAEGVLASLNEDLQRPGQIHQMAQADMKFPPALDSQGQPHSVSLGDFLMDTELRPDTTLRRNAWASLTGTLKQYENIMAANLNGHLGRLVRVAKLRGFPSVFHFLLESRLHGLSASGRQSVSVEAFHNVLDVVGAEVAPHMRRYARLRKRVLGLDKLYLCDVQAQLPAGPDLNLTWEQGREWITGATSILGPEYTAIINRAYDERWIDWAVNQGKPGTAFSYLVYGVHPYIFSAFTGGMRSLFVLAHELGHAGHEALSDNCQNYLNNRWHWFFGEAPSTLNELLLARHIRQQTSDPNVQRRVLMTTLATYHHNFATHLIEAQILRRFFQLLEEGKPITAGVAGDVTVEILRAFWGDEVEVDDAARVNWMRQPHYYMGLQPYTYAVGLAGSTAVAEMIATEGAPAARRWVEVLKAGSSMGANELFLHAGVDMTAAEPLRQACTFVGRLVDELAESYE